MGWLWHTRDMMTCSPGSDLLNNLTFLEFVSSFNGAEKQCLFSGKFEL